MSAKERRSPTPLFVILQSNGGWSGQTEIGKRAQVVIGRALGKTAEHDMGDAAIRSAQFRGDGSDRDPRCPIGGKSIDAGRYRRKGDRFEAVRRCKVERDAITGRQQLFLYGVSAA